MEAVIEGSQVEETETEHNRWLILVLVCVAQFMVVLDATIVNVALPSIQRGLHFTAGEPAVDRQRLHARLRRLPAARRARVRPARTPAPLHRGPGRLHGRVVRQRHRDLVGDADRRPCAAGPRCRARLARRALDRHDDVRRRRGAHEGARHLERDRRRRRRGRARARRPPHRDALVALGVLHQPADRAHRGPLRAALHLEHPRRGRARDGRRRGRGHGHRRPARARLHDRQGAVLRLGLGSHARRLRACDRPARHVRRRRVALEGPADPARHLPAADALREQHRHALRRLRALRDVLLRDALPAGDPPLRAAQGRASPSCRSPSGS